jgi:RIO kinase 3
VGVDDDDAYNSFRQSMQRQKGGTGSGRATSDTDSGEMDQRVRMLITRAINNLLIEKCNGIVREGKEAVIYHADQGEEGGGYDVAIKVFRHIEDVRGRNDYVDGDPRFDGKFQKATSREKPEILAEREYRNLLRANRSGVPVPTPLIQKENVVFMRFLGEDGLAVPQLKDLQIRKGSDKWTTLYSQIMVAIRRYAQLYLRLSLPYFVTVFLMCCFVLGQTLSWCSTSSWRLK